MSNKLSRKILAFFLAVLMLTGGLTTVVSAENDGTDGTTVTGAATTAASLQDMKEILSTKSYSEYLSLYGNAPKGTQTVKVDVKDYNADETTADVELLTEFNGKSGDIIKTGDYGKVVFNVDVPEAGLYAIRMSYFANSSKAISVERNFYINGKVPFTESRCLKLSKTWEGVYNGLTKSQIAEGERGFKLDRNENEVRPDMQVVDTWQEYTYRDSDGYYSEPLLFYFEKGANTMTLESVKEEAYFADIELFAYESLKSYEDVLGEWTKAGYTTTDEVIHIDAEQPDSVSNYSLYSANDTSSVMTEPSSPAKTMMNYIQTGETNGEWVEYKFNVEKAGLYTFTLRFMQTYQEGYTSRVIYIDGEIPYAEAMNVRFKGDDDWQVGNVSDGSQDLQFYLSAGEHTVRFETTLGTEMGQLLRKASDAKASLNSDYLSVLKLTGADPDEYTDYGFGRVMPDVLEDFVAQSKTLYEIVDYLEANGKGKSEVTTTVEQIAELVQTMGTDERKIAKNLEQLKTYLGTLGSWVTSMMSQGLDIDWIDVQSVENELPDAEAGFFARIWYQICRFFYSFIIDYSAMSAIDGNEDSYGSLEVWTASVRDAAQIVKNHSDNEFADQYKTAVTVKIVTTDTLLPSILAGIGPDIALPGMTTTSSATATSSGSINDFAIRGAVLSVDEREGFEDLKDRFSNGAFEPITLDLLDAETKEITTKVYGVPVSESWSMMFYRKDILSNLNLELPDTWDDLLEMVPILQFNNMEIGLTADVGFYTTLIIQMGGDFWTDEGMRVDFDSNIDLEAFEVMMNMFTQYSLPISYDPSNRFRTGETPIIVTDYLMYNTFTLFSTELGGLWGFTVIPGTLREDGVIDRSTIGTVDAICMLRGCKNEEAAWNYLKWYSDEDFQVKYSNEYMDIIGEGAKWNPANLKALDQISWSKEESDALKAQAEWVTCLKQYPGYYIINRNVSFSVRNTYNNGQDPVETLLGYLNDINNEISRKRKEFGLETLEIGQTLAEKRLGEAKEIIDNLGNTDDSVIKAALEAIEAADTDSYTEVEIAGLRAAADALAAKGADYEKAVTYMKDAADRMESYN